MNLRHGIDDSRQRFDGATAAGETGRGREDGRKGGREGRR